ncbi:MAG: hypothetical protein M3Y60_11760 [Bacteroidota bacterium]|nr:hypothetical protein [Bacteroidota bacterium]
MDLITSFLGRFHPLLVHLPIGILFLAFLFECLSFKPEYRKLKKAIQPALFWGSVFAIAAAITGFFLRQEGGYEEALANRHQNSGIITAVLSLVVYVLRPKVKHWVDRRIARKRVKLVLLSSLMVSLLITGHLGGSLTHGEDYLFAVAMGQPGSKDPAEKIRQIQDIGQAVMYNDVIQPIFEARCYDCHSTRKQKGDLRLDKEEFIMRGGKDGLILTDAVADSSALYKRLVLPLEHDDHMPPGEKPQLTSSEIALIKYWIEEQVRFDKPVTAFENREKIAAIIKSLQQPPQKSWIPTEAVGAANENAVRRLKDAGVDPMPLGEESNYLMVTFAGHRSISNEQIGLLREIEEQLVWLNLSFTNITDSQLEEVSRLGNLRALYLNNTAITDNGLEKLSPLGKLRLLSIVATSATDRSVETFARWKNLNSLFVYQTGVTGEGMGRLLEENKDIRIDSGNYNLEKIPADTIVYRKVAQR